MYKFSHLLNKVGMLKKKTVTKPLSAEELELIEQLREHPELLARFQNILEITRNEGTTLRTADEVEGLLVEEMRRLGHAGMSQWAVRAQERARQELKSREPQVRSRKKNTEVVVRVWLGGSAGADLVHGHQGLSASFAGALGSITSWAFAPTGSCADGLWLRAFLCLGGGKCVGTLRF
jgi:hypothetical protein